MKKQKSSSRVGFLGLLFLALIILKLAGFIDWGWGWVSAPIWGTVLIRTVSVIILKIFTRYDNKNN